MNNDLFMKGRPLVVIAGPTASGKSDLAVETARRIGGEVISADSMQVYRYMDIGTGKITKEEMMGVPHHMIDVAEPSEKMDVTLYQKMVSEILPGIYERGRIPIICGGTGFYIQAVCRRIDFSEAVGIPLFRKMMEDIAAEEGPEAVHRLLSEKDPEAARAIHPNNVRKVIRALEFFELTGEKISEHNSRMREEESPFDLLYFVLSPEREKLYAKIEKRVDRMIETGLADEVAYLKAMGISEELPSMQGLGYKEMIPYLDGKRTLEEAIYDLKLNTRHYAKRQVTWFKREASFQPVDYINGTPEELLDEVLERTSMRWRDLEIKEPEHPFG